MELFRGIDVDWLGKKWYFLGFSLIFSVAGLISIFFWHGIPKGVDFKGGTLVYVSFDQRRTKTTSAPPWTPPACTMRRSSASAAVR